MSPLIDQVLLESGQGSAECDWTACGGTSQTGQLEVSSSTMASSRMGGTTGGSFCVPLTHVQLPSPGVTVLRLRARAHNTS